MSIVGNGNTARFAALGLTLLAVACGAAPEAGEAPAPTAIQIGGENVVRVERGTIQVGPIISGALRAQRRATVRAEVGGSVLEAPLEEGDQVRAGALVARIEARSLEGAVRSAESAVRSAEAAVGSAEAQRAVTERELERSEELVEAGAIADRELDVARQAVTASAAQVTAADAQLADARARLVAAEEAFDDVVLRAPIDGVVAERPVGLGDVVAAGAEVITIIDPTTMELEAAVPSERLGDLRVGQAVLFEVRGYAEPFEGTLARISPQVDPATRQVSIFASIPNTGRRLVSGLFAEGRVLEASAEGLLVPTAAVNDEGEGAWVLRVENGMTARVPVTLGLVDTRTEQVQILDGVVEGDVLLRGTAQGIAPGTPVQVAAR